MPTNLLLGIARVPSGDDAEKVGATVLEVNGEIMTIRIRVRSWSDSGKRNLLDALLTNAEVAEVAAMAKPHPRPFTQAA